MLTCVTEAAAINPQLHLELTTDPSKLAATVTVHEVEKQGKLLTLSRTLLLVSTKVLK